MLQLLVDGSAQGACVAGLHGGGWRFVRDDPETKPGPGTDISVSLFNLAGKVPGASARIDIEKGWLVLNDIARDFFDKGMAAAAAAPAGLTHRTYGRIAKAVSPTTLWSEDTLKALGEAMAGSRPGNPSPDTIPAAYTYLGQFIAHDISRMRFEARTEDGGIVPNPGRQFHVPWNKRGAALDLDSLFDAEAIQLPPEGTPCCKAGLCVGQTIGDQQRFEDLPRTATGVASIVDDRNDANLAVAQMQVAIAKFHQVVARVCGTDDPEAQRSITRRHFQSIVLHDFLERLIDPRIYEEVLQHGRGLIYPDGFGADRLFLLPVEFAAACFRFGHSMVRPEYQWNSEFTRASPSELLANTHRGGVIGESEYPRLQDTWVVDWHRQIDLTPTRTGDIDHAAGIDTSLASALTRMDKKWFEPDAIPADVYWVDLATVTLLRGRGLGIPSAQKISEAVTAALTARPLLQDRPRQPPDELTPAQVAAVEPRPFKELLEQTRGGMKLSEETPLWLYTLREAEVCEGGGRLGPLASRIVMETLHAAIAAAPGSIIESQGNVNFTPHPGFVAAGATRFTLPDLLRVVRDQWRC